MRKIIILAIIVLLALQYGAHAECCILDKEDTKRTEGIILPISKKQLNEEVVIVPDNNPFFGIIGTSMACWYDTPNISELKPLLFQNDGELTNHHKNFLEQYLNVKDRTILVLGEHLNTTYQITELLGTPPEVAIEAARYAFVESSTVMIIPYSTDNAYELSLIASPLASYLNIPILIYDENEYELQEVCNDLNVHNGYIIGNILPNLTDINIIKLENEDDIQNVILTIIKERFGEINYITLTNPSDVTPPYVIGTNETRFTDHITNTKLTFLGKSIDVNGKDIKTYEVNIPSSINRIQIYANITESNGSFMDQIDTIVPIISLHFYDNQDNIVAYSSSLGYDFKKTYIETLACNAPGNYKLKVNIYNGIKGGFFTQRGISVVNTNFEISIKISELEKPHMPLIPKLSMTSPYLASAHGGIIIADPKFGLTSNGFTTVANGSGTGPWYNEKLHNFTNTKVNYTIEQLEETLSMLDNQEMLQKYLNGPAWLAILADTNMIPMYYYGPSQGGIYDKGLPSDNPYSLDWNISVGRIVSYDIQDVSLLIARTLFYQDICSEPYKKGDWHNKFSFIFGEGYGETGGIFHQIPYSFEIRKYGFQSKVYGDLRNGRQITNLLETYTDSNYIEYLGHGDWFWYTPSLYGLDMYSKAIDVAHAKNWVYSKPSIFLTSACLMGRIDGIPPNMNIGLTMLHAGCNCFVGATRMTGQEAGLTIFENHLIVDDLSVGEALREEKRVDRELPTYYVRVLYGDPAFNPYEPNNGFSKQGRPELK